MNNQLYELEKLQEEEDEEEEKKEAPPKQNTKIITGKDSKEATKPPENQNEVGQNELEKKSQKSHKKVKKEEKLPETIKEKKEAEKTEEKIAKETNEPNQKEKANNEEIEGQGKQNKTYYKRVDESNIEKLPETLRDNTFQVS